MKQPSLFQDIDPRVDWHGMALSCSYDEAGLIRQIMALYNGGLPIDLDPAYGRGRIWDGLPKPRLCMDISPRAGDVIPADVRHIPLGSGSVGSVFFDPPFLAGCGPIRTGIMRDRFSYFHSIPDLWAFYADALREINRVLKQNGLLVVKCQDTIDSGTNYISHAAILVMAADTGFYCDDLLIYINPHPVWSPNMRNQKHARKIHSYFLVLRKIAFPTKAMRLAMSYGRSISERG